MCVSVCAVCALSMLFYSKSEASGPVPGLQSHGQSIRSTLSDLRLEFVNGKINETRIRIWWKLMPAVS